MVVKKANGVLAQLRRTIIYRNKDVVINLFKTFVRPILESAGTAWCPWERKDIDAIERIQRRATKLVPGLETLSYEERLQVCNLTTLEQRRERGNMIQVFKMLNGYINIDNERFFCFTSLQHDFQTRAVSNECLVSEKCHLEIRKNFFTNRIVSSWNALPKEVRDAESVNSFKNNYDDWKAASTLLG